MKKVFFSVLICLITSIFIFNLHKRHPIILDTNNISFKISHDRKNIYYKENKVAPWKLLFNVADTDSILNALCPFFKADAFAGFLNIPDKHKILIQVCDNSSDPSGDGVKHWDIIYDLHAGKQSNVPGNQDESLSQDHKFIYTERYNDGLDGNSGYYIVDLDTNKTVVALDILDSELYVNLNELDNNVFNLLQTHGIIIKNSDSHEDSHYWDNKFTFKTLRGDALNYDVVNSKNTTILSLEIDPAYVKNNRLDGDIEELLKAQGIVIQPQLFMSHDSRQKQKRLTI